MSNRTVLNFWLDVSSLLVMLCLTATGGIMYFVLPPGTGHSRHLFGLGRHDFGEVHFYLAVAAVVMLALHVALHWSWVCGVVARAFGRPKPSSKTQMTWGWSLLVGLPALIAVGLWWASGRVERVTRPDLAHDNHAIRPRRTDVPHDEHAGRRQAIHEPRDGSRPEADTLVKAKAGEHQDAEEVAHERRPRPRRRPRARDKRSEECPAGAAISGQTTLSEAARACGLNVQEMRDRLRLPASASPGERLGRLKRPHGLDIRTVRELACRS